MTLGSIRKTSGSSVSMRRKSRGSLVENIALQAKGSFYSSSIKKKSRLSSSSRRAGKKAACVLLLAQGGHRYRDVVGGSADPNATLAGVGWSGTHVARAGAFRSPEHVAQHPVRGACSVGSYGLHKAARRILERRAEVRAFRSGVVAGDNKKAAGEFCR